MLPYAVTIFLGAFLLFQVEPLIAKIILPWFGGSAAVWNAALLFFQLVLLLGYLYAHCLIRYLKPKQQTIVHCALLTASMFLLPILPSPAWKPAGGDDPTPRILALLGATIGLPYLLLSATSPLLQAWYVRARATAMPYRLFALSNFGSMLALISFPAAVEPWLTSRHQAFFWSGGYVVFAILCGAAAWRSRQDGASPATGLVEDPPPPRWTSRILWIGLAACASAMLLGVTTDLTQNIAPVPLLWIVPLSLYLLSFIFCFESDRIYQRGIFVPLFVVSLAAMAFQFYYDGGNLRVQWLIPGMSAAFFICAMVCHGELARRKPHPRYLTSFYLMVSAGGAVGGLFAALIAPHIFNSYLELPLTIVAAAVLAAFALWNEAENPQTRIAVRVSFLLFAAGLAVYLGYQERADDGRYRLSVRNFYGVLRVRDDPGDEDDPPERVLIHGTINHGEEILTPGQELTPISYYGPRSGVGRAMAALQARPSLRVGVVGLGAGVLAAYCRPGDVFRFYEINPDVLDISTNEFAFFKGCRADKQVLLGDARLTMERQPAQHFDLLAVDAFSGDSIPIHLLTEQAFALDFREVKPDGVLAVHVSNKYLDLVPVVARAAADFGRLAYVVDDDNEQESGMSDSTWVLVTTDSRLMDSPSFKKAVWRPAKAPERFRPWTDDYSNLLAIFK